LVEVLGLMAKLKTFEISELPEPRIFAPELSIFDEKK